MSITEVKKLVAEKLGWNVTDVYYLCTDKDQFSYYLVYKNHRIRNVIALDELNGCVLSILNQEDIRSLTEYPFTSEYYLHICSARR